MCSPGWCGSVPLLVAKDDGLVRCSLRPRSCAHAYVVIHVGAQHDAIYEHEGEEGKDTAAERSVGNMGGIDITTYPFYFFPVTT